MIFCSIHDGSRAFAVEKRSYEGRKNDGAPNRLRHPTKGFSELPLTYPSWICCLVLSVWESLSTVPT